MQIVREFHQFVREYKVLSLAIAFVIGAAATGLVQTVVNQLFMPIITSFIPGGAWQTATWKVGRAMIGWGPLLSSLINFIAVAVVVFLLAKYILREQKVSKK